MSEFMKGFARAQAEYENQLPPGYEDDCPHMEDEDCTDDCDNCKYNEIDLAEEAAELKAADRADYERMRRGME